MKTKVNKLTTEEFINKAKLIHGDKYDYSVVNYVNCETKITMICPEHGGFSQTPPSHLTGRGCPKCGKINCANKLKKSKGQFISDAILIHGNKYDYSLIEYKNSLSKIKIKCQEHGCFEQRASAHLDGQGCPKCGYGVINTEEFIKKSNLKHNNKYNYSLVNYIGSVSKVKIICPIHGEFEQKSSNHLRGGGCKKCSVIDNSLVLKKEEKFFLIDANKIHNTKYDYSLVKYINNRTKIKILCPLHGIFEQRPDSHLSGQGCPTCGIPKPITNTEFINKAKLIHSDKYDYSLVNYINSHTKVRIICKKHGEFKQEASSHLSGCGCSKCSFSSAFKSTESFVFEATLKHGEYDYSLVNIINSKEKVKIICKKHGEFKQTPSSHLSGSKCPKCAVNYKSNINEFIKKANLIHGNLYDYTESKYINIDTKIDIICEKHGLFKQTPYQHINRGNGCPICKESRGEREIRLFLSDNNINFERQKRFDNCKHIKTLPFDFYLIDVNTCIEYDGEQHDKPFRFEQDDSKLKIRKLRDNIKTEFCLQHNINLIRINYNDCIINKLKENITI